MSDPLETILSQISDALQNPELKLNEDGICAMRYDNTIDIVIEGESDPGIALLYSPLVDLPADAETRAGLLEQCMHLNYLTRETRGATLGLDFDLDRIVLSYRFQTEGLDPMAFQNLFGSFVETALDFYHRFTSDKSEADDALALANRLTV